MHETFKDLWDARQEMDEKLVTFTASLSPTRLGESLHYTSIAGDKNVVPVNLAIGHLFNHHTHHRGQVHAGLTRLGHNPPDLDIIYFYLEVNQP